jgi:hypothetical protein
MSQTISAAADLRASRDSARAPCTNRHRVALVAAGAIFVLAAGLSSAQSKPSGASDGLQRKSTPSAELGPPLSRFLASSRAMLKRLQEQLATQADTDRDPGKGLCKEITDLMSQLRAAVEQAQSENATANWEKLKPRVHAAAVRYLGAPAR